MPDYIATVGQPIDLMTIGRYDISTRSDARVFHYVRTDVLFASNHRVSLLWVFSSFAFIPCNIVQKYSESISSRIPL